MNATIEIEGLRKRFGPVQALDGMTFTVQPGRGDRLRRAERRRQVSALLPALEQLPRHHHALDLVRPLVDLGDRGPQGSFRR
jgi:hypothetical protein